MHEDTTLGLEFARLRHVRERLNAEGQRLAQEYGRLREEGAWLYGELGRLNKRGGQAVAWSLASRQFLEAYGRLQIESEEFHAACEQYVRDTARLNRALLPLLREARGVLLAS